jgi:type IV secretion system protein VirD4
MRATRILWGQILLVLAIVAGSLWGATQWTAWRLGFQPELGAAWFHVEAWPIYPPGKLFWWWYWYDAYAPNVFATGGLIAASGGIASIAAAIALSVLRAREARAATTFGSARWASLPEARNAGLTAKMGVVLAQLQGEYLRHDGAEHVLCFAPTRSGKGVGLVIPTLLTWTGSAVVHDIKGENWQLTAGWRATFGRVLRFDPTSLSSDAYNPLLEVRRGPQEVRDVQNIADILVDPEGALERRNHWEKTSHSLLVGAILHVLYAEPDKTLAGVAAFLSDPRCPIEATLLSMLRTPHLGDHPHPVVASAARELLNKSENERSGVLSTAMSFLGLYRDPVVAHVTRRCDWTITQLATDPRPTTLYLVVPPSDISRTKPLVRLILNQIGRRLTEELPIASRHRLLLMLDEFPALGRLDFFESTMAFMAGYGLKAFLIAQSLNQIERAYGPNHAILDNCHVRVSFATNDERTAKRVSDALGTATEIRDAKNYAGHRLSPWLGHLMVSRQETARPLLTPGEVMQLPPDEALVMVSGVQPIRARKVRYYKDAAFKRRVLPPPPRRPAEMSHKRGDDGLVPEQSALRAGTDGGLRQEPTLGLPDDMPDNAPADINATAEPAASPPPPTPARLRAIARQAAMDPDDGIQL